MTADDLDAVVSNEFSAYAYPWTRGIFSDCLNEEQECWVGSVDGTLVGHLVITPGAGEAHLLNVCVRRESQGHGYGRTLTLHALDCARAAGADALFLEVRPSNLIAARLYESLGFVEVGLRKNYYPADKGREDARVMVLDLEAFFRQSSRTQV
ncbi:MAG: ribosomal protein S18-alanine N-acetyltransferase [Pseudomonadales bacterium]|nr:ribosomal protein S18-alanine N-acetyltransferase [Pseudomonadales bacterium]